MCSLSLAGKRRWTFPELFSEARDLLESSLLMLATSSLLQLSSPFSPHPCIVESLVPPCSTTTTEPFNVFRSVASTLAQTRSKSVQRFKPAFTVGPRRLTRPPWSIPRSQPSHRGPSREICPKSESWGNFFFFATDPIAIAPTPNNARTRPASRPFHALPSLPCKNLLPLIAFAFRSTTIRYLYTDYDLVRPGFSEQVLV
mmetsp:Transcript_15995/g.34593  ORF Transcript_15995/g.34593 Transcript_15995/m.34593 type:complete len:200 (-) Transcript_15995:319-918(-)